MTKSEIFWLDDEGFDGTASDGFFIRCSLFETFKKFESQGYRIVGLKKPTDWNLEVICIKDEKFGDEEKDEK